MLALLRLRRLTLAHQLLLATLLVSLAGIQTGAQTRAQARKTSPATAPPWDRPEGSQGSAILANLALLGHPVLGERGNDG